MIKFNAFNAVYPTHAIDTELSFLKSHTSRNSTWSKDVIFKAEQLIKLENMGALEALHEAYFLVMHGTNVQMPETANFN